MMPSLREIAATLGGEVAGGQVLAPGPGHGPRDRSLAVKLSAGSPDGFVVHSFAGDDFRTCRDHVAGRLGLGQRERQKPASEARRPAARPSSEVTPEQRRAMARKLWAEACPARDTLVEIYLRGRGIELPADIADVLRFHPRCPWRDKDRGETIRVPAMVAAMRSIETDELEAVHRTRLSPDGRKIDRRMLGIAAGPGFSSLAAVKLDVNRDELVVGEGVETCLAARQLGLRPTWALGSAGAIAKFPILPGVKTLKLLMEVNDVASERAVAECAARWHAAGRRVVVVKPNVGKDMNDALRGGAA